MTQPLLLVGERGGPLKEDVVRVEGAKGEVPETGRQEHRGVLMHDAGGESKAAKEGEGRMTSDGTKPQASKAATHTPEGDVGRSRTLELKVDGGGVDLWENAGDLGERIKNNSVQFPIDVKDLWEWLNEPHEVNGGSK
jgi:hypothetical protein